MSKLYFSLVSSILLKHFHVKKMKQHLNLYLHYTHKNEQSGVADRRDADDRLWAVSQVIFPWIGFRITDRNAQLGLADRENLCGQLSALYNGLFQKISKDEWRIWALYNTLVTTNMTHPFYARICSAEVITTESKNML
jgi:hypothetical protein